MTTAGNGVEICVPWNHAAPCCQRSHLACNATGLARHLCHDFHHAAILAPATRSHLPEHCPGLTLDSVVRWLAPAAAPAASASAVGLAAGAGVPAVAAVLAAAVVPDVVAAPVAAAVAVPVAAVPAVARPVSAIAAAESVALSAAVAVAAPVAAAVRGVAVPAARVVPAAVAGAPVAAAGLAPDPAAIGPGPPRVRADREFAQVLEVRPPASVTPSYQRAACGAPGKFFPAVPNDHRDPGLSPRPAPGLDPCSRPNFAPDPHRGRDPDDDLHSAHARLPRAGGKGNSDRGSRAAHPHHGDTGPAEIPADKAATVPAGARTSGPTDPSRVDGAPTRCPSVLPNGAARRGATRESMAADIGSNARGYAG